MDEDLMLCPQDYPASGGPALFRGVDGSLPSVRQGMGIGAGSPAEARLLERPISEGGGGFRLLAAPGSGDELGAAATAASTDRGASIPY